MSSILPPPETPLGEHVARRLRDELIVWLTTVGADGTPHPNPVWFLWDGGDSLLVAPQATRERWCTGTAGE